MALVARNVRVLNPYPDRRIEAGMILAAEIDTTSGIAIIHGGPDRVDTMGLYLPKGEYSISEPSSEKGKDSEDKINWPKHYNMGEIEPIEAIEDWKLGPHEANVIKYVARAKHKGNELEDLKKARWYLDRKIKNLECAK